MYILCVICLFIASFSNLVNIIHLIWFQLIALFICLCNHVFQSRLLTHQDSKFACVYLLKWPRESQHVHICQTDTKAAVVLTIIRTTWSQIWPITTGAQIRSKNLGCEPFGDFCLLLLTFPSAPRYTLKHNFTIAVPKTHNLLCVWSCFSMLTRATLMRDWAVGKRTVRHLSICLLHFIMPPMV